MNTSNDGSSDLEEYIRSHIDSEFYLELYPDVAGANLDAATHWLNWGCDENRMIHPSIVYFKDFEASAATGDGWQFFDRNGETIGFKRLPASLGNTLRRISSLSPDDLPFVEFVSEKFNHDFYAERYPDVGAVGIDAIAHWLEWGFEEGRVFDPFLKLTIASEKGYQGKNYLYFTWRGKKIRVRRSSLSAGIISQVRDLYKFEPAIFAPGADALPALEVFDGPDLYHRNRADVDAIFDAFTGTEETIVVIPFLIVGGAERYAADIVNAISLLYGDAITVVLTEQSESDANWEHLEILQPMKKAKIVYWRDVCKAFEQVVLFARLLNVIRPKRLFVINSRLGYDVVATHGRGLSQHIDIFCAYFSVGPQNIGNPYGSRFPKLTGPYSTTLTDNSRMQRYMEDVFSSTLKRTFVLPPNHELTQEAQFLAQLEERVSQRKRGLKQQRWLWFSRVEVNKGTYILNRIAESRPDDIFDVYGPGDDKAVECGLVCENIHTRGMVASVHDIDMSNYDGFLFTSLFEGMPNAVLEVAQHAIPMVIADVGGLRDTFSSRSVLFVDTLSDDAHIHFVAAMDQVMSMEAVALHDFLRSCRNDVRRSHSSDAYHQRMRELIENA